MLNMLNKIGVLRSYRPLSVRDLAVRMIGEVKSLKSNIITVYKTKDLFVS